MVDDVVQEDLIGELSVDAYRDINDSDSRGFELTSLLAASLSRHLRNQICRHVDDEYEGSTWD